MVCGSFIFRVLNRAFIGRNYPSVCGCLLSFVCECSFVVVCCHLFVVVCCQFFVNVCLWLFLISYGSL